MSDFSRRNFIKKSLKGTAVLPLIASTPLLKPSRVLGANDRIRIALIGCGGRGSFVARGIVEEGAELTYLCDLNNERLDKAEQFIGQVQEKKPKRAKDMRTVFDSKDVDAVVIATPDHWHGPASILACQAGKDVYVEKPHAHNIYESQKMIEASKKYNRIIEVGTQNRSAPYNLEALDYVKSGKLGKIGLVKVYNLKPGSAFKLGDPGVQPKDFNWDKWLGPAPQRPYHEKIFDHGWHKFWDFSGGDLVDDGIHQLDLAMMLMGDPALLGPVSCNGGRYVYAGDDAEVPDVQIINYEFENFVMTFELTNYPRYMQKTTSTIRRNDEFPYWTQNATRIEIYGSEMMLTVGRHGGGWQVTTSGGKVVEQMYGRPADFDHYKDFINSLRTRNQPSADVTIAHKACLMAHMANISHRLGNQKLHFDAKKERFENNKNANKFIKREYRDKYRVPENV